jgi:hypothetical protein
MTEKPNATATKRQDKVMPAATLSELCNEAAEHIARARFSLFDETSDAEPALAHLDEAIFCLKRMLAHGRAMGLNGAKARPA